MVRQLTQQELNYIANNYIVSKHAIDRLRERFYASKSKVKDSIIHSDLAYINTDGSINVKLNNTEYYYVFIKNNNVYKMITCKHPSDNGYTLQQKFELAMKGIKYFHNPIDKSV